jgi:hypothetical protein
MNPSFINDVVLKLQWESMHIQGQYNKMQELYTMLCLTYGIRQPCYSGHITVASSGQSSQVTSCATDDVTNLSNIQGIT